VRVRVHLYERAFPAKPVRHCDGWSDPRGQLTSTWRRTRQCHRHGAVSPDDRDMHVGRERPPTGQAWGEEGGSQMWVAHAPHAAVRQRLPRSLRHRRHKAPPASRLKPQSGRNLALRDSCIRASTLCRSAASGMSVGGNGAPEFRFPPPVPPEVSKERQPGKERWADDSEGDER
jgi:hypothetical protein